MLGLGLTSEGQELKLTTFFGADEATNKKIAAFGQSGAKAPWSGFITKDLMVGIRTTLDMDKLWAFYKESIPAEQREKVMADLKRGGTRMGVDIEKDVIANMTGNFGVFFYGLDLGGAMGGMNNPGQIMQSLNLAIGVQFKDKASLDAVIKKVSEKAGEEFSPKPVLRRRGHPHGRRP